MRRSVHLNNFLVAATSFTIDCVAPNVDETGEVASSTHAQVSENRMQFVDENGVSNLTPIQKFFASLLVISNVLNVMNTQFGFDFVVLNETQPLECVSMSVCQVHRMIYCVAFLLLHLGRR